MKKGFSLFAIIILMAGSALLAPARAFGETVSFPLNLDYSFLNTLVIHTAFTGPGRTMILTDPDNDCQQISLANPKFSSRNNLLQADVAVHLKGGTLMGENCLLPMEWDGYLIVNMKPRVIPGAWQLAFDPVDSVLLDKNHRPAGLAGHLWNFFKAPVMARMGHIRIAVNEPVDELKPFLQSVVPETDLPRMNAMLASLRPGSVAAGSDALKIKFTAVIEMPPPVDMEPAPKALTPKEINAFIEIWETWDAFLVRTLTTLTDMPLTSAERETLLTVLLDTRYRFIAELKSDAPADSGDFVREQFVEAWQKLSPIFKNHLAIQMSNRMPGQPGDNSWGYLAFFTASDALAALDKLGPLFNIEISKNGFIRLARMLSENKALALQYSQAVDPDLRKLLDMTPPVEISPPSLDPEDPDKEYPENNSKTDSSPTSMNSRQWIVSQFFRALSPKACWAKKAGTLPSLKEMRHWLVTRDNVDTHLQKIKPLMDAAFKENLKKNSIPENYHKMFQKAAYATAWQESCFRQFVVDDQKLMYIRSYNNTSVGMMQINERVWRGMYSLEQLRWNIRYNVEAGMDILSLYLKKYALPKMKSLKGKEVLDNDGVACALYAMYNEGPGGFSGYVKRRSTGKFSRIDNHFKGKYNWVKNGQWDKLGDCY